MPFDDLAKPGSRLTMLIFVTTAAVAALLLGADWLMVALGPYLLAYWAVVLVWMVCVVCVIRRQRRWWVLGTALVVLYPAARMVGFLVECSQKACIF